MSRFYHAARQNQEGPTHQEPQPGADSVEQSMDVKVLPRSSRKKGPIPPPTSSLFSSDPEENVRLWMQQYFPGVLLSREEAIRQWLARPPEFRVQIFPESPANGDTPDNSNTPAAVTQEAINSDRSNRAASENPKRYAERAPQLILGGTDGPLSNRSRKLPKLLFRIAAYSILAFLIIKLLWAIPMTHMFPHADASIPATPSHKVESGAVTSAPVPQSHDEAANRSEVATQPSRIESVSIGCKDTQPCVVITMLGKENVPKLSALNGPDRLVIDFQDSAYSSDIHLIAVNRGAVKAVRIGGGTAAQSPSTRIVVDLAAKCDYELNTLTNKFIVNIYPKETVRQPK
jgi:AMIN domain